MIRIAPRRVALLLPLLIFGFSLGATAQDGTKDSPSEYPGMVDIPAGRFKMGIDEKALIKMFGDPKKPSRKTHQLLRDKDHKDLWWNLLLLETPEHEAETEAFAIDVYPVTNAQYRQFLEDTAKGSFFTKTKYNTIALVAESLFGQNPDKSQQDAIFWLNEEKLLGRKDEIYKLNAPKIQAVLDDFNIGRPDAAKILEFDKLPDKQRAEGWVEFLLPDGIALTVYKRGIPDHWPKGVLPKEMESWPVVFVSARDADAFAEWAGKHVPSEAEYEKAARGPKDFLYPWGRTWNWQKENNLLVWFGSDPEPAGPAAPYKDRVVDVARCPKGVSQYGIYHMLGNLRVWTSSLPHAYPGSNAKKEGWFGNPDFRVLRGTAYGDGKTDGDMELVIRNTARAMHGGAGGIGVGSRYPAVGIRCAKYMQPARDVLRLRIARARRDGTLPSGLELRPRETLGVEKSDYVADGGTVFVRTRTKVIGFVPTKRIVQVEWAEKVLLLGYLCWNADVSLVLPDGQPGIPRNSDGYLVGLVGNRVAILAPAAFPRAVGYLPGPVLGVGEPADPPPGLEYSHGTMRLRVDYGEGQERKRLTLSLTFRGTEVPDETWRR